MGKLYANKCSKTVLISYIGGGSISIVSWRQLCMQYGKSK